MPNAISPAPAGKFEKSKARSPKQARISKIIIFKTNLKFSFDHLKFSAKGGCALGAENLDLFRVSIFDIRVF